LNEIADSFVRVRFVRITGVDLALFEFDFDCTWFAFFMSADEVIYGRYGGRDASSDDSRISLAGLKYAAEQALVRHKAATGEKPPSRGAPIFVEQMPAARARKRQDCIHCHQINEFRRADLQAAGKWDRNDLWVYPLPENVGITLDVDRGDLVNAVKESSAAANVGIKAGDSLVRLNGYTVNSFADGQFALHKGPRSGSIPVEWKSGGATKSGKLEVAEGWRKSNITWRSSMLDILPSLLISGDDLTPAEKKSLGLPERNAAFRQDKFVHSSMKAIGIQKGDIIVAFNGKGIEGTMEDFLGFVRREHLVGDKATVTLIRDGKPMEIALTLK